GGDALAGHSTGTGGGVGVGAVGPVVVEPADVTTDVDGGAGDDDGGVAVAAAAVPPGGLQVGAPGAGLPAGGGVALTPAGVAAGGDNDEVAPVGRHVDVTHVAVELRLGADDV